MIEADQVLIVTCSTEQAASSVNEELTAVGSPGQVLMRNNLTGDAATWMVVASSAITTLPKILDSLAKLIGALKIRSIKIGDNEIRNPTAADIKNMRKKVVS